MMSMNDVHVTQAVVPPISTTMATVPLPVVRVAPHLHVCTGTARDTQAQVLVPAVIPPPPPAVRSAPHLGERLCNRACRAGTGDGAGCDAATASGTLRAMSRVAIYPQSFVQAHALHLVSIAQAAMVAPYETILTLAMQAAAPALGPGQLPPPVRAMHA